MNRIWTKVSVRAFAVFVLVVGLVAGTYLGLTRTTRTRQAADARSASPSASQTSPADRKQESADTRDQQLRDQAGRDASQNAQRKAQQGSARGSAQAKALDKLAASASPSIPPIGPIPASCSEYSGNKAVGCAIVVQQGYGMEQMVCLSKLWDRESHWNVHDRNPGSGAYGIPQALPGNKMASAGDDWEDNPATQIKWGLGYIKGRYSSPCGAWNHSEATGWY